MPFAVFRLLALALAQQYVERTAAAVAARRRPRQNHGGVRLGGGLLFLGGRGLLDGDDDLLGVELDLDAHDDVVEITARVRTAGLTGVEMEALTAASVAALTIFDMIKAVDNQAVIGDIKVIEKSGGRSGDWRRSA